jgi:ankyrin repeat protein
MSTELYRACCKGNYDDVCRLLTDAIDINHEYDSGTLLHVAILCGWYQIVELLLKRGANIHMIHRYSRMPPLFVAVAYDRLEIARLLLDHGANISMVTESNYTITDFIDDNQDMVALIEWYKNMMELKEPAE